MMRGWLRGICIWIGMGVLAGGAYAATSPFSVTLQADGTTLGAATGVLDLAPTDGGRVAWTLSNTVFQPASVPGTTVQWSDANLDGAGSAAAGERASLAEFEVTVRQSSGVDVVYRFRLSATLTASNATGVALEQLP